MSYDPTPNQALLLFSLLARHGACAQAELLPKVNKSDRDALVEAKLISTDKVSRRLQLTVQNHPDFVESVSAGSRVPRSQPTGSGRGSYAWRGIRIWIRTASPTRSLLMPATAFA